MVFQNYALYPHMSVYDNMAYGLKIAKVPKAEIEVRVQKAAKILELGALLERTPRQLSGGQRQRVAMGRAIVRQPAVFLFDEPLSNLDAKLRAQTRLEIQKLHRELGVTSLFVTHDQVEAMTLAQRMIVMNAGRIEQIGTPEQVYGQAGHHLRGQFHRVTADEPAGRRGRWVALQGRQPTLALPAAARAAGALMLGVRPEHADLHPQGAWSLKVEMLEMLGAERLVYGRLGDAPSPCASTARWCRRNPATWCRCTWPPAPALVRRHQRAAGGMRHPGARVTDWPYPLVDRPPRRRHAGAREHAGRLSPGRAARLPLLRMRRQAQRRRRALPAARRHAGTHHQRPGPGRRPALVRAVAAGRRRWHGRAYAGETAAHAGRLCALAAPQRLAAGPRDQAHAGP
jgi:ABC-type sugar transport system ATPase subunit